MPFHSSHQAWKTVRLLCSIPKKLLCFISFKWNFHTWKLKLHKNIMLILDGMIILQLLADLFPATFGDLRIYISRYIVKFASFYLSSRFDFVCDKENQKTPIHLRKFLISGKKKRISCSIYDGVLEEIATKRIPWKKYVCFIKSRMFHVVSSKRYKWRDYRKTSDINIFFFFI